MINSDQDSNRTNPQKLCSILVKFVCLGKDLIVEVLFKKYSYDETINKRARPVDQQFPEQRKWKIINDAWVPEKVDYPLQDTPTQWGLVHKKRNDAVIKFFFASKMKLILKKFEIR